ncbi:RarD protein, DMT superfamily transporter [Candidatus Terasakiella magnetica]|uniref:RarD protein, DMT superfamily transporter n=1 Tax=Candidatus Terasakiella magnetica TaxID=1867952 RepID=A0A1C3RDU2_9PROT|nr:EamA family transporter RarD [Candidatus Terasakiella magnetica]SCA55439.1 RarD protein, DMT superfamily transporter [Candidatus Terasakiella magnetica]
MSAPASQKLHWAAISALAAYVLWGAFGLYFKALSEVSALEVLCHRIVWSVAFLALIITLTKKWPHVAEILANRKRLFLFALSAMLISINWGVYIYAVISGQALEGSMGYFIMPLVAVLLGAVFFAERFSKMQGLAIGLALLGVLYQILAYGKLPWIAVSLALSFGFYGMLRKKSPAESVVGLFLETLIMTPIALFYMGFLFSQNALYFTTANIDMQGLLMLAGPVTAVPLILFAFGARQLRYSTVGILQYINPTCQFLLAIFIFLEPFELDKLVTFGFIWAGVLLYSMSIWQQSRAKKAALP